ncbi:protein of unknown function [Candidatus Hydrogenisulfobacillus filiaventi]|uniref:Uncharacterized protein n=1 Tax=Candidatus Hydrogenisulfobacillus filiaventi TaxID=2707344 RepID=A0A6F8ZIK7_9FIRM|nr:protein of unknown function [Candidatus Hydrogenisulfobacillus filiaventi]
MDAVWTITYLVDGYPDPVEVGASAVAAGPAAVLEEIRRQVGRPVDWSQCMEVYRARAIAGGGFIGG